MCVRLNVSRGAPDDCKREQACGRPDALRLRVCGMVFIARRCFARLACDLGVPAGRSAKSIRLIAPPDPLVPSIWTLPITVRVRALAGATALFGDSAVICIVVSVGRAPPRPVEATCGYGQSCAAA